VTLCSSSIPDDIRRVLLAHCVMGEKINAVKVLRAATGLGLREAKDAVEADPELNAALMASIRASEVARSNRDYCSRALSRIAECCASGQPIVAMILALLPDLEAIERTASCTSHPADPRPPPSRIK